MRNQFHISVLQVLRRRNSSAKSSLRRLEWQWSQSSRLPVHFGRQQKTSKASKIRKEAAKVNQEGNPET